MSEIVAKWIVSTGIDPAQLVNMIDNEFDESQLPNNTAGVTNTSDKPCNAEVSQHDTEQSLLIDTQIEIEAKDDPTATTYILGRYAFIY